MKLYYAPRSCSLGVIIVINELCLDCEYERVDLQSKETETGDNFLSINPKGSVPALLLERDLVLTESAVIQKYLAEKNDAKQLLPGIGDFNHYRVLEWLNFIHTDLHKGCFSVLYQPSLNIQLKNDIYMPLLLKRLSVLDQALKEKKYLLGENFTLADASLFVILIWLTDLNIDFYKQKNLFRYFNTLKLRPSIVSAVLKENE